MFTLGQTFLLKIDAKKLGIDQLWTANGKINFLRYLHDILSAQNIHEIDPWGPFHISLKLGIFHRESSIHLHSTPKPQILLQ